MSIRWAEARVERVIEMKAALRILSVQMKESGLFAKAMLYADEHGEVAAGDRVLVNTTAVELGLGTGGYHFVHAVLAKSDRLNGQGQQHKLPETDGPPAQARGHMMKLRYTSLQRAVWAAEEEDSPHRNIFVGERSLEGMPVLIGELHSMLPIALCWLRLRAIEGAFDYARVNPVYVMTDGGALPLAYSRHAYELSRIGMLGGTITYGHAYGGEIETMNKFTALLAARHVFGSQLCIVAMGPGIAGTGTTFGHTGMEVGEVANAVRALGGNPIVIPRISFAERRERHHGLSHHLFSLLRVVFVPVRIPLPMHLPSEHKVHIERQLSAHELFSASRASEREVDFFWYGEKVTTDRVSEALRHYPHTITSMGRDFQDDAAFFLGVCCAAEAAISHLVV